MGQHIGHAETAKPVTYSSQVGGVCSATLDDDIYDPLDTLSGGLKAIHSSAALAANHVFTGTKGEQMAAFRVASLVTATWQTSTGHANDTGHEERERDEVEI